VSGTKSVHFGTQPLLGLSYTSSRVIYINHISSVSTLPSFSHSTPRIHLTESNSLYSISLGRRKLSYLLQLIFQPYLLRSQPQLQLSFNLTLFFFSPPPSYIPYTKCPSPTSTIQPLHSQTPTPQPAAPTTLSGAPQPTTAVPSPSSPLEGSPPSKPAAGTPPSGISTMDV
jgi:hypothetical protein